MQKITELNKRIEEYEDLLADLEDLEILVELVIEEEDQESLREVERLFKKLRLRTEDFKLSTLLTGEFDSNNAIVSIHSGAGGG